jgi:Holliday junction resolvase RusA-like endonuclease
MIQILQKGLYGFTSKKSMLGHGPFHVEIELSCEDEKKRDASNMAESVMDLLVDTSIIDDDCIQVVPSLHPIAHTDDKKNPKATVKIFHFKKQQKG